MNSASSSDVSSRFSLILLEPGEIYFEDYLVYYHELKTPFSSKSSNGSSSENDSSKQLKGNLKICSKSVVFDPINLSYPLVKFSYKSIERIEKFNEDESNSQNDDLDDIYSIKTNKSTKSNQDKHKYFAISSKQIVLCKTNNKIEPYRTVKRENQDDLHYFQFIFTNVNDSLDLLCQLHRASTLEYEQEDLMLQLILKSRLSREIKFDIHHLDDIIKEKIQFESIVNKINPLVANPGRIILTNMCLYYKPFNNLEQKIVKIKLKHIKYVIKRRYHLKRVGCEIIFDNNVSNSENTTEIEPTSTSTKSLPYLYLTFEDEATRDLFFTRLVVEQRDKLIRLNEFTQENMLQKWRYGAISNFDYLMYLNNMADRSYNDLTQYPVFPWVICDYTSETLDLNDAKTFRDLSRPIGALNEDRLLRLRQRCEEMQASTTSFDVSSDHKQPIFLYGSHYSTPAFVLFYLVRLHPEWQLCLQSGRFDNPDRLFYSIADTWKNCLSIDSDVKELIPEFYDTTNFDHYSYYSEEILNSTQQNELGSFLKNNLELDLGVRQDGNRVNNVLLPKWANNNYTEFIMKMREALESSYVNENLHKWIDLIFGYKQRGDEALKADNLFYYLCYEGAVDLDSIKDYSERKSLEIQIQEFGQIPTKLFDTPHLQKAKIDISGEQKRFGSTSNEFELIEQIDYTVKGNHSFDRAGLNLKLDQNQTKSTSKNEINSNLNRTANEQNIYKISASNFTQLSVKLNVKLHKSQVNECIFLEQDPSQNKSKPKKSSFIISSSNMIKSNNNASLCVEKNDVNMQLPLVCSVSNDNWIKIYSIEDRSIFRSHNVSNFNLSSVDCIQILTASSNTPIGDDFGIDNYLDALMLNEESQNERKTGQTQRYRSMSNTSGDPLCKTLLYLSCWDNSMYIYDMNYNRCIHALSNSHDDAISRVRLVNFSKSLSRKVKFGDRALKKDTSLMIITSSWDSLIKIWRSPLPSKNTIEANGAKFEFVNELCHDSSVLDFQISPSYLASICDDGNLYLWRLNKKKNDQSESEASDDSDTENDEFLGQYNKFDSYEQIDYDSSFTFMYAIQSSSDMGKINDCKIIESSSSEKSSSISSLSSILNNSNSVSTIAICTSLGFVKIFNIQTNLELFSLKISVPSSPTPTNAKLNKLFYTLDYIITIDTSGYIYFIDLQQVANDKNTPGTPSASRASYSTSFNELQDNQPSNKKSNNSFLSHFIKLGAHSLQSLCIYKDSIICVGDLDGNLYFLSLIDI